MSKVISLTVIIVSLVMMGYLMFRNVRRKRLTDKKQIQVLLELAFNSMLAFTWFFTGDPLGSGIAAGLWLAPFALVVLLSPRISTSVAVKLSNGVIIIQALLIILNFLEMSDKISLDLSVPVIVFHLAEGILCLTVFTVVQ